MLRIGVDGGGTTTRAVVIDDALQVQGRGEAGSSNHYSVGLDRMAENIARAVDGALQGAKASSGDVAGWGVGLAGACTGAEQGLIRARLMSLTAGRPLVVDEDAAAAQYGAFGGEPGAVCIAGTGANCFGINAKGERARADGLGPLLGDRGSGYWIGEKALRELCRAHDGSGPATSLGNAVLEHMGIGSIDELVQTVYRPDFERDRIAALFPVVVKQAAEGDTVALSILQAAGRELASTVASVLGTLGVGQVAVTGGVISRDTPVREAFESALQSARPGTVVGEPLHDATVGAALLSRGHA